jgi:hypothetical protein
MNACRSFTHAAIVCLGVGLFATACKNNSASTSTSASCTFSVGQPTTTAFGPEGGTGSVTVTVTAGTGCTWTATTTAAFVTFTPSASGTGTGTVNFTVAANTGADRTTTLTIAGTAVTITQRAAGPAATLSAPTVQSPSGGQGVAIRPTLVVNNAASTGNIGTVTYRFEVSDDSTFPADPAHTITQDGVAQGSGTTSWAVPRDLVGGTLYYWRARATNGTLTTAFSPVETFRISCSFSVSPASLSVAMSGGTSTVTVGGGITCSWTAASNSDFITLTSATTGTGNGSVTFSVASNAGALRTGTLTVAGQTVTVIQAGPNGGGGVIAAFQLFDLATQGSATTECRFRSATGLPTTCTLQSTSYTLGTSTIVSWSWTVQYTYATSITVQGVNSSVSFQDTCGQLNSTNDGVSQPLSVTLTVTDTNGVTATATSGRGSQPPLFVRLYLCGS